MTETTTAAPPAKLSYMIGDPAKANARISFVLNGRFRSYLLASAQGQTLAELLRVEPQDIDAIGELADIPTWIAKQTHGRVTVDDCERLRLDGKLVDYGLAGRITKIVEQGADFGALCNFVERVSENPDTSIAEDLYRFLEKGDMPITPEGLIMVFKRVDQDYRSYTSGNEDVLVVNADGKEETVKGRIPHPVGGEISMARELCNPNRNQTCSVGLHGCSFEYLSSYHGGKGKIVIGMIDPRDVTAIPMDANDSKLRCCRMKIVDEVPEEDAKQHFKAVVDTRYPAQPPEWKLESFEQITPRPEAAADEDAADRADLEAAADARDAGTLETIGAEELRTRLKLTPIEGEEAAGPSTPPEWSAQGYTDGHEAGVEDRKNGYDYEPSFTIPEAIAEDDVSRGAYSKAFVEAYDAGYRQEPVEEEEPDVEDAAG